MMILHYINKCKRIPMRLARIRIPKVITAKFTTGVFPEVHLKTGVLQGTRSSIKDNDTKPVYKFLGVPFAAPPIGKLRFQPHQPPLSWKGTKLAHKHGPAAPQDIALTSRGFYPTPTPFDSYSEDCLHLDVYTPSISKGSALPVMFWIHGGSFCKGSSGFYDGTAFAALEDVVVVIANYRLGALGFLTTDDGTCTGNLGLHDQLAALMWVQNNIESFGGDPGNVTAFGESAGAVSVHSLLTSPMAKGLIHKAIAQSGSALVPNVMMLEGLNKTYTLAKLLGCTSTCIEDVKDYLCDVDVEALVEAQTSMLLQQQPFSISVDGTVLLGNPFETLKSKETAPVPMLLGCNQYEGLYFLYSQFPDYLKEDFSLKACMAFLNGVMKNINSQHIDQIVEEYFAVERRQDSLYLKTQLMQLFGDYFLILPTYIAALYHSDVASTYFYNFTHRPSYSHYPDWVDGPTHVQELLLSWGEPWMDRPVNDVVSYTSQEKEFSRTLLKYWANFARNGNPNGEMLVEWPELNYDSREYLDLNLTPTVASNFKKERTKFFEDFFQQSKIWQ